MRVLIDTDDMLSFVKHIKALYSQMFVGLLVNWYVWPLL